MKLTRLHLRNYRVFEEALDLELPGGLVGIYGPNGAGKSTLLEAVLWALWGKARTTKDEIRTADVNAECLAEVQFEHEGHLYGVRRTISGAAAHVKAEAFADGHQIAVGVRDVARYVHSVLGMDDNAFRASVFAEQKQLALFSSQAPEQRRRLVLQLLGITPLDGARDQARKDARTAREEVERVRSVLLDLDELRAGAERLAAEAERLGAEAAAEAEVEAGAQARLEEAEAALAVLDDVRREYDSLVKEGRAVRTELDQAEERVTRLEQELEQLEVAEQRLVDLEPAAARLPAAQARLALVKAVDEARAALQATPAPDEPPAADEGEAQRLQADAEAAGQALARLEGELAGAEADLARARDAVERASDLSGEGICPTCGQALGDAFQTVQQHRAAELDAAHERLATLRAELDGRRQAARLASAAARQADTDVQNARRAWAAFERARDRRAALQETLDRAVADAGELPAADEAARLTEEVERLVQAAREADQLRGRLERRAAAAAELATERARRDDAAGRRGTLKEKLDGLGYEAQAHERARAARDERREHAKAAGARVQEMRLKATEAAANARSQAEMVARAEAQHALVAERAEDARHLGRVAELMTSFRTEVIGAIGPRLSVQAAELFAELTDREYDLLEVDPETYEIKIRDAGRAYGMDRFSGSEIDLANLALRVAISEQVRFQSGGAVGLLVLDEVFGPLDDDRRERMLLALERLRARFRQILVVTHATEIKEQLPGAIEVRKLPGRRATARVLAGT